MTTSSPFRLCLASSMAVLLAAGAASAETTLKWKFKEGDVLNYVMENSNDMKMDRQGQVFEFGIKMVFDVTWKVKGVAADGTADIDQIVDRVQFKVTSPFANLDYDSKSSEQPQGQMWEQMSPIIKAMTGEAFGMKVSPAGKVTDIKLPEKMVKVFEEQKAAAGGDGGRRRGLGALLGGFSENGVKEMIQKSVMPLPEKPVAGDTTWSQKFEEVMPGAGTQKTDVTYAYSGSETQEGKSLEKITSKIELTFEPADNAQADVEITKQEGSATVYFDSAAGRTVKGSGTQKFIMEIAAPNAEITREVNATNSIREGKSPDKPKTADKSEKTEEKKAEDKK